MNIRSVQKQKEYFKHKCTESDNDSKIQFDDYDHYMILTIPGSI